MSDFFDAEELFTGMGFNVTNANYWEYYNIPVSAGLNYTLETESKISLIGEAGLALSFLNHSDFNFDFTATTEDVTVSGEATVGYDMGTSLGAKLGGGVLINDNISIKINYWNLGEHDLKGEQEIEVNGESFSDETDKELKVDYITLTLGFKL